MRRSAAIVYCRLYGNISEMAIYGNYHHEEVKQYGSKVMKKVFVS